MKIGILSIAFLVAQLVISQAQDTWVQKADFETFGNTTL